MATVDNKNGQKPQVKRNKCPICGKTMKSLKMATRVNGSLKQQVIGNGCPTCTPIIEELLASGQLNDVFKLLLDYHTKHAMLISEVNEKIKDVF